MSALTEEDKNMLRYFYNKHGDLRNYEDDDRIMNAIREDHPNLWRAMEAKKVGDRLLELEMRELCR